MAEVTVNTREFASQDEFVGQGRKCGTPQLNEFQKQRIRHHVSALRQNFLGMDLGAEIKIPVRFHIIHNGPLGQLTDAQVDDQINVLQDCFAPHNITFSKAAVTRTDNEEWFDMTMGSAAERKAKRALGTQTDRCLNLYSAGLGGSLLGWATFPSDYSGDPERDGVVIVHTSLPGGEPPYDLGKTAVHEVGHWLGLYHTFEGGCTPPGDEVEDTPFEASANYGPAKPNRNTCPNNPGNDPTTNYMDYSDDAALMEFTGGQARRVREQVALYRPNLGVQPGVGPAAMTAAAVLPLNLETGVF